MGFGVFGTKMVRRRGRELKERRARWALDYVVRGWPEVERVNYKEGKPINAEVWKPNGGKCPETNLKDGTGVMVLYYANGTKMSEENWKDGKQIGETKLFN